MNNLDSVLKSRDITLSTKVHLVKAMVFPVVMYGCESWTINKAECQRIDAFIGIRGAAARAPRAARCPARPWQERWCGRRRTMSGARTSGTTS